MDSADCPRCRNPLDSEGRCPRCLLDTALFSAGFSEAELIFQAALSQPTEEQLAFAREAAGDNSLLYDEVRQLIEAALEDPEDVSNLYPKPTLPTEQPGDFIDHFELIEKIGQGGMGTVWKARQTKGLNRIVALKVIKLGMDTGEVIERFSRERQTLASLRQDNIARIHEAGATGLGRPYFVMEHIDGVPITLHCEREALGTAERISLFLKVCSAIEHAHQRGIIHRDLKPSNILVPEDGSPKIIDFGIAKFTREAGSPLLTRQTQILGTPAYMSPEQAIGDGAEVDTRSDVYSLGILLYEILCGQPPFDPERLAGSSMAGMQKILLEESPAKPSTQLSDPAPLKTSSRLTTNRKIERDLDWIVLKAIAKEPDRRYQSASSFSADLECYLKGEVVQAAPPRLSYHLTKFVRRHKVGVSAAALVIAALVAGIIVSVIQIRRTNQALAGEAGARLSAQLTVADLYTNSGLSADQSGNKSLAALWFAKAAVASEGDPDRVLANQSRTTAWRQEFRPMIRLIDTGFRWIDDVLWNPDGHSLIIDLENTDTMQIWDITGPTQWLPGKKIQQARWSPDGTRVALFGDEKLEFLSYPSGHELLSLPISNTDFLRWSPDGESLFIFSSKKVNEVNVSTGTVRTVSDPPKVRELSLNRTGTLLMVQTLDHTHIHEAVAPFLWRLSLPSSPYAFSRFLGDGKEVLTFDDKGNATVTSLDSQQKKETYRGSPPHPASIPDTFVSPSGRYFTRTGWGLIDRETQQVITQPAGKRRCHFSHDEALFISGNSENQLSLHSLPDGRKLEDIGHPHFAVLAAKFSQDSELIASAENGLVKIHRTHLPKIAQRLGVDLQAEGFVTPSGDGKLATLAGHPREFPALRKTRVYEIPSAQPVGEIIEPNGEIIDAIFGPSNEFLALAVATTKERSEEVFRSGEKGSGTIQLWNFQNGSLIKPPLAMPSEPRALCLHPGGQILGIYCAGGEALEFDLQTRKLRQIFALEKCHSANGATVSSGECAFSPDGSIFAVWAGFEIHVLWHRKEERHLVPPYRNDETVFDLHFHDDLVVNGVATQEAQIELRGISDGNFIQPPIPFTNWPMVSKFDPSGDYLLIGGGDNAARVIDRSNGIAIGPDLRQPQSILGGDFLPRSSLIAIGGYAQMLSIGNAKTGMPVRPDLDCRASVIDVETSANGESLLVSTLGGPPIVIDLARALPPPLLTPQASLELAQADSGATVREGGGLNQLRVEEWVEAWRAFRKAHPDYPPHQILPAEN